MRWFSYKTLLRILGAAIFDASRLRADPSPTPSPATAVTWIQHGPLRRIHPWSAQGNQGRLRRGHGDRLHIQVNICHSLQPEKKAWWGGGHFHKRTGRVSWGGGGGGSWSLLPEYFLQRYITCPKIAIWKLGGGAVRMLPPSPSRLPWAQIGGGGGTGGRVPPPRFFRWGTEYQMSPPRFVGTMKIGTFLCTFFFFFFFFFACQIFFGCAPGSVFFFRTTNASDLLI